MTTTRELAGLGFKGGIALTLLSLLGIFSVGAGFEAPFVIGSVLLPFAGLLVVISLSWILISSAIKEGVKNANE